MNFLGLFGLLDVVIVVVVIIFLVIGWKKGFLEKVIDMASSIFGLVASILLARPFADGVLRGLIGPSLETSISNYLVSRLDEIGIAINDLTQTNLREALSEFSLPQFMIDALVDSIDASQVGQQIIDALTPGILSLALIVISFIVLFFGSMLVFFLLKLLAKGITSVPIIKQIDKVLGVIFGFIKVALLIYILLFILALVINIPAINNIIYEFLDVDMQLSTESFRLSKYLYNNNLLRDVVNIFVSIV